MGLLYVRTTDGRKKPSVWVWIFLLFIMLAVSAILVYKPDKSGLDQMKTGSSEKAPKSIQLGVTSTIGDLDAETQKALNEQLEREREMNNGFLDADRENSIRKKFGAEAETKRANNFQPTIGERLSKMGKRDSEDDTKPVKTVEVDPGLSKTTTYKTFEERLAEQEEGGGAGKSRGGNGAIIFGEPPVAPRVDAQGNVLIGNQTGSNLPQKPQIKNILPLGTFIPCVLDGDIVTSQLQSYVWANVVVDVTFRRQMQLPKGLVRIRGKTGTEPVQNVVDVFFDTMVFSDGTELPISGVGYAAFDPRYPHRFRTRGIPGELIVPPMWVKAQQFLYTAAAGASDAYIQNAITAGNQENGALTPSVTIDPITGQPTTTYTTQSSRGQENIGRTLALGGASSGIKEITKTLLKDLEKYQPYVIVEKGTPFFIQLDQTVDVDTRQVNGTAIKQEAIARQNQAMGIAPPTVIYAPGDARATYTGVAPSTGPTQAPNMNDGLINGVPIGAGGGIGASGETYTGPPASAALTTTPQQATLQQQIQNLQSIGGASRPTQQSNSSGALTPEQIQRLLLGK